MKHLTLSTIVERKAVDFCLYHELHILFGLEAV
jgi:hypothetical protein